MYCRSFFFFKLEILGLTALLATKQILFSEALLCLWAVFKGQGAEQVKLQPLQTSSSYTKRYFSVLSRAVIAMPGVQQPLSKCQLLYYHALPANKVVDALFHLWYQNDKLFFFFSPRSNTNLYCASEYIFQTTCRHWKTDCFSGASHSREIEVPSTLSRALYPFFSL